MPVCAAGEPDFDTPDQIKTAAIDAINSGFTKYTPTTGIPELKKLICEKFSHDNQLNYAPEQIVVSCGAKHSIFDVMFVLVDKNDKAFQNPSKPIGGFMDEAEAKRRQKELGWSVVEDSGRGWRRVVASPLPKEVVELESVETLIKAGTVVVTVGGGGIPVIDKGEGEYAGTAAVIDKDFASSLLARLIKADLLLISTAVEKVALNFGKPDQKWIDRMTLAEAKQYLAEGTHFAKGSMAPKIQAIIWFLEAGGKQALITNPENIGRALKGETGTWIVP